MFDVVFLFLLLFSSDSIKGDSERHSLEDRKKLEPLALRSSVSRFPFGDYADFTYYCVWSLILHLFVDASATFCDFVCNVVCGRFPYFWNS